MEKVVINGAQVSSGHYSAGIISKGWLFISGQLPVDPWTGERCTGDIREQTARVLENIRLILTSSRSSLEQVVKMTIFIADYSLWAEVDQVYAEYFGQHKPARIVIASGPLFDGALIEAEAIAEVGGPA